MLSRDRSVTWISLFRIFLETAPVKILFLKSQNYRSDFHTKLYKKTPHLKSPFKLNQGQRCIKFNVLRDSPLISSCKSSNIWSIKFGGQGCGYLKFIVTIHMHIYVFFSLPSATLLSALCAGLHQAFSQEIPSVNSIMFSSKLFSSCGALRRLCELQEKSVYDQKHIITMLYECISLLTSLA